MGEGGDMWRARVSDPTGQFTVFAGQYQPEARAGHPWTTPLGGARNLRALDALARAAVPALTYDYIAGGAEDERTLTANEAAFGRWVLVHRVLRDVHARDPATTALGRRVAFPVLAAPTAFHKLVHPDGEAATARGVAAAGSLLVASTLSTVPLEDVARAAGEAMAEAVQGKAEVHLDGGVRRGTDVLIVLALGALAVLVGRPLLWALALGGAAGVEAELRMHGAEFDNAMALCGLRGAGEAGRDVLARA